MISKKHGCIHIVKIIDWLIIDCQNFIASFQTNLMYNCIHHPYTMCQIFVGQFCFPPNKKCHGINHKCKQNVYGNSSDHDDQSLPSWFAPELPRLSWLFHLLFVHALINHTRDLHVSTQWQPSDAIHRIAYFLFDQ